VLPFVQKSFQVGAVGSRPVLIDDEGRVRPAALAELRPEVDVVDGGCTPSGGGLGTGVDLDYAPFTAQPAFALVTYRATGDLEVRPTTKWAGGWTTSGWPVDLPAGRHTRLVPLATDRSLGAHLEAENGGRICVERATIVRALVVEDGGATCRTVDWYGRPGHELPCP
jgi:hypothetical protein